MRHNLMFVVIFACSSIFAMQLQKSALSHEIVQPTCAQIEYVKILFRSTLDPQVRSFMSLNHEDRNVAFLNRYIEIATHNFWKKQISIQKMSLSLTQKDLTSFVCQENLCKLFGVKTTFDLQMYVGAMGVAYDFYQPCNTWTHVLAVVQEQIKRKCACMITMKNWPIKSLERKAI